jgi:hypothetical protein
LQISGVDHQEHIKVLYKRRDIDDEIDIERRRSNYGKMKKWRDVGTYAKKKL